MYHIIPPCHVRNNLTVSSRDGLWSESQKLISLTPTSFQGFQDSEQAVKAKTQDWWASEISLFSFVFSSCFIK